MEGLATVLVVLGIGGLAVWLVTRGQQTQTVTAAAPPCNVNVSGVSIPCSTFSGTFKTVEHGAEDVLHAAGFGGCAYKINGQCVTEAEYKAYVQKAAGSNAAALPTGSWAQGSALWNANLQAQKSAGGVV